MAANFSVLDARKADDFSWSMILGDPHVERLATVTQVFRRKYRALFADEQGRRISVTADIVLLAALVYTCPHSRSIDFAEPTHRTDRKVSDLECFNGFCEKTFDVEYHPWDNLYL